MKTRHIFAIVAVAALTAGLTGCKSDEELAAKPAKEVILVEEGSSIVMASGDMTKDVKIRANCAWKMSLIQDANNPWDALIVQPAAGNGDGTLVIQSDQNTAIYDRLDTIMLTTDGGLQQKIAVRQKSGDPTINISQKTMSFAANPLGAQLLTINSNDGWNIVTPAGIDWLHIDKLTGGTGAQSVNVSVDPATTDVGRSTSFNINYGTSTAEVVVKQNGMSSDDVYLHVNTSELNMSGGGGEQMLYVESNAVWRAFVPSSAQSWLWIEPAQGVGNGEIRVRCEPNQSTERERMSLIVFVAGNQNPKQFDVLVQQGTYTTSRDSVNSQPVIQHLELMHSRNNFAEMVFMVSGMTADVEDYGLVYSQLNQSPALDNSERRSAFDQQQLAEIINRGGSGEVWGFMENLQPGTYYVRAYVRTKSGVVYSPNVVTVTATAQENP